MTSDDPTQAPRKGRDNRPVPRVRKWWRLAVLLVSLPLVFASISAVMLFDRDIAAPTWVADRLTTRVNTMLGGGRVDVGDITVRLGRDLHPRARLTDTVLHDANDAPLARVATLDLQLSPRGLLFEQAALVQNVTLSGTQIALRRNMDGSVALAFDLDMQRPTQAPTLAELLGQLDRIFSRPALVALRQVEVTGLTVNYSDARANRNWTVDDGAVMLDMTRDTMTLAANLPVRGAGGTATLDLSADTARGTARSQMSLEIENLPARDLASQSPALAFLAAIDAPLTAKLATGTNASGALLPLAASLDIGAGSLHPTAQTTPLHFDAARLALTYDPVRQLIRFDEIAVNSDWGKVTASGQAFPDPTTRTPGDRLIGQFSLSDIVLSPGDLFPDPVTLDAAQLDLRLTRAPFAIDIGQLTITDPDLTLTANGTVTAGNDGWHSGIDLKVPQIGLEQLLAIWPPTLKPGTRKWFRENLTAGLIKSLTGGIRTGQNVPPKFALGFDFENAQVRYLRTFPHLIDGAGHASLIGESLSLTLDEGHVLAPQGGAVDVAGSVLHLPHAGVKGSPMTLDLTLDSTVTAALSLLDQAPFNYLTKANLPVTLTDGRAQTQLALTFPVKRGIKGPDVDFSATAILASVRSDSIVKTRSLRAPRLDLTIDKTGLSIAGPVTLDGVAANGRFRQPFGKPRPAAQISADVTLTPDALSTFGVRLPPGLITGRGQGQLDLTLPPGARPLFTLTSDMRGLALAVPAIGVSKAAQTRGDFSISGQLGKPLRVDAIALDAPGLRARGDIQFTGAGQLDTVRLPDVRLGNWFEGPVILRGRGQGRPVGVEVTGGTLDLRLAQFGKGNGGLGGAGLPITLKLDRLWIAKGLSLTNMTGAFNTTGGINGRFAATANGTPTRVTGTVAPSSGRTAVRLQSADAGGVLRAAGFVPGAQGGSLDLTLIPVARQPGAFDGTLAIRALRLRDAPSIAALLDAISVVGLLQQLDGQGLAFDEVDARFRLTPDQITVTQSSAVGPGLGISVDGIYTLANKAMDFQGVVSPFYFLNGIGSLFTRKGEGLIGFNFNLGGTADAPQVAVNPLSILTPGGFREIFRRPPPQLTQ